MSILPLSDIEESCKLSLEFGLLQSLKDGGGYLKKKHIKKRQSSCQLITTSVFEICYSVTNVDPFTPLIQTVILPNNFYPFSCKLVENLVLHQSNILFFIYVCILITLLLNKSLN